MNRLSDSAYHHSGLLLLISDLETFQVPEDPYGQQGERDQTRNRHDQKYRKFKLD